MLRYDPGRKCYICGQFHHELKGVIPICKNCRYIWDIKEVETPTAEPRPMPRLGLPSRSFADDGALWEGNIG